MAVAAVFIPAYYSHWQHLSQPLAGTCTANRASLI